MTNTEVRKLALVPNQQNLVNASVYADRMAYFPGRQARAVLSAAGDVVEDETVTIGADVYKFKALDQDSGETASLATGETISLLTASGAMTWAVGDLLGLETEIVKIQRLVSGFETTKAVVLRGRCGTTVAAHVAAAILQTATATTTQIPVGVFATLTPAVWVPALVAEINNAIAAGAERATGKASTIFDPGPTYPNGDTMPDALRSGSVQAVAGAADAFILVRGSIAEVLALATTETMTNGVWTQGATMVGGAAPGLRRCFSVSLVPTAAEDTFDSLVIPIPFEPTVVLVDVRVTATGIAKGWVGGWLYDSDLEALIIDNAGATDWAVTDTVTVFAAE